MLLYSALWHPHKHRFGRPCKNTLNFSSQSVMKQPQQSKRDETATAAKA
jgi:hypothetical protein